MRATYDSEANALYVRVSGAGRVGPSKELDDRCVVDLDAHGGPVGVELLSPDHPYEDVLAEAAGRFGIDGEALLAAVRACVAAPDREVTVGPRLGPA